MRVNEIIEIALNEDHCDEDVTTNALISESSKTKGAIYAGESGVIAGLEVARDVFRYGGSDVTLTPLVRDGEYVQSGQRIAEVEGNARVILSRERVALNFLQHLSGIATATNKYVKKAGKTKILDTRKTTPGLRELEKYAVRMGSGYNHRFSLVEMVMIKDNHIALTGSIKKAVKLAREYSGKKVELETKKIDEVREAVEANPDMIMLDNMSFDEMREAIEIIHSTDTGIEIEVSGGITLENIAEIAELGPDYASCGALTHSVKALEISLELDQTIVRC